MKKGDRVLEGGVKRERPGERREGGGQEMVVEGEGK